MKKVTLKKYYIKEKVKVLNYIACFITDGNKTYEAHYSVDQDGKRHKSSSSKSIDGRVFQNLWYGKMKSKVNFYYYKSGQSKRIETISNDAVQFFQDFKYDQSGNLIVTETEDALLFHKITTSPTMNKSSITTISYDKYTEPLFESIEVEIFNGSSIVREIKYFDFPCAFENIGYVQRHYEHFVHSNTEEVNYVDFSGEYQNITGVARHNETHYEYHDNGKLKRKTRFFCKNYDKDGNVNYEQKVVGETLFNTNGMVVSGKDENNQITRHEYVFNDTGDWIESRKYRQDELISISVKEEEVIDRNE